MPLAALPTLFRSIFSITVPAVGPIVDCYVRRACKIAPSNEPFSTEDLASSIIPGLNETVQIRAASEGLLETAAATGYCGVPQYNFDMCNTDLGRVTIYTSIPGAGVARFDNVPPTCMVLSTVLTGGCGVAPPYPTVCGSACLQYSGLSESQFRQLGDALRR
ncbi:hypothetical protein RB213_001039 [Colletotrichum asianum]